MISVMLCPTNRARPFPDILIFNLLVAVTANVTQLTAWESGRYFYCFGSVPISLVFNHANKSGPRSTVNGSGIPMVLLHMTDIKILRTNHLVLAYLLCGVLVLKVRSLIKNLLMALGLFLPLLLIVGRAVYFLAKSMMLS